MLEPELLVGEAVRGRRGLELVQQQQELKLILIIKFESLNKSALIKHRKAMQLSILPCMTFSVIQVVKFFDNFDYCLYYYKGMINSNCFVYLN